jgi:hypothetical protein
MRVDDTLSNHPSNQSDPMMTYITPADARRASILRIRRTSHRKNFQADKSTRKFPMDLFIEYLVGGCEDKDLSDSAKQHTEG